MIYVKTKHFSKKKMLAVLAAVAVFSAMLGGCSNKDTSTDKASSEQVKPAQKVEEITAPIWSGEVAEGFAAGDGTAENP